jgi:bla regulator protein blaR1
MNMINNIFSEGLINSFGWTLVHSLWQGVAIALGLVMVLLLMRKYSARTRYLAGVMALVLMFTVSMVTFVNLYDSTAFNNAQLVATGAPGIEMKGTLNEGVAVEEGFGASLTTFFKHYFQRHLPLLVTIWFMGMLVLTLRFAGGFLYNWRIKTQYSRALPDSWQNQLLQLRRKIGVSRPVTVLESALVKVPMAMGHLKPVILLPMGLVTGLPREQVEALLAHELAHILRRDYLINMLQNMMDIFYFFHPGIRWISSLVRNERENCCDDIAVSCAVDSMIYAKALTNIQEADNFPRNLEPAVAVTGKVPHLFNRIKRLLKPSRPASQFREGFVGALIMIVCIVSLVASVHATTLVSSNMYRGDIAVTVDLHPGQDLAQVETEEVTAEEQEQQQKQEQQKVEKQKRKEKEKQAKKQNKKELKKQKKKEKAAEKALKEEKKKAEKKAKRERKKESKMKAAKHTLQEIKRRNHEELKRHKLEMVKIETEHRKAMESSRKEMMRLKEEQEKQAKEIEMESGERQEEMIAKKKEMSKTEKEIAEENVFLELLVKKLLVDKLIDNAYLFDFNLSTEGLLINGVKQSQAVFKKYKSLIESNRGNLKKGKNFHVVSGRI